MLPILCIIRNYSMTRNLHLYSASNQLQSNTEFQPQQPIPQYNDPDIIATMRQFHDELATLEAVKCSTCLEQFPSIAVNDNGICRRCHNDTKIPKLFSSDNNMDPGAVPPQLTVSIT